MTSINIFVYLGRFQVFASLILVLSFLSGSFIVNYLQFLTLKPQYECSNNPEFADLFSCKPDGDDGFCKNQELYYRVSWQESTSLDNWFVRLHL